VGIEIASLFYKSHRTKALPTALGFNCCQALPDPSIASEETKRDLSDLNQVVCNFFHLPQNRASSGSPPYDYLLKDVWKAGGLRNDAKQEKR